METYLKVFPAPILHLYPFKSLKIDFRFSLNWDISGCHGVVAGLFENLVPDDALTEEDEDILNYDDIDDPDAFA